MRSRTRSPTPLSRTIIRRDFDTPTPKDRTDTRDKTQVKCFFNHPPDFACCLHGAPRRCPVPFCPEIGPPRGIHWQKPCAATLPWQQAVIKQRSGHMIFTCKCMGQNGRKGQKSLIKRYFATLGEGVELVDAASGFVLMHTVDCLYDACLLIPEIKRC